MSSTTVSHSELPSELNPFEAVEAAYPAELTACWEALRRGLPVLIECDKELTPFFYRALRDRLKKSDFQCSYLDGRTQAAGPVQSGTMGSLVQQLRDAVRGSVERKVLVLPHLDLLTSGSGHLTSEAREVIPLLYENPNLLWVGFKDPSFSVPKVIENLFPHHESLLGLRRERLAHLVTQKEARKLGKELNIYSLYKHVSGLNAVRLRRLLASLEGEDYPSDPGPVLQQLRRGTLSGELSVPELDLHKDIGGYEKVKKRLQREIIDILAHRDASASVEQIKRIESLVPRGMIFLGPPGTGKTLFAKAMASALGAAVQVVSGPELKSRWVGQSEENIRQIFVKARQSAPSVIIFDELDSIAPRRGSYSGSGVEHSMVNQLLTEMDGFRSNEMVFIVGTTNYVESLDPALMRPGRFEFQLEIPVPNADDRRAIFKIYDQKLELRCTEEAIDYVVKRTRGPVEGTRGRYTGDHIQALCRAIARRRIRQQLDGPTEPEAIETTLLEYIDRPDLTEHEEFTVATHECGHAVVALYCESIPPIDRISIRGDLGGALGFVSYDDPTNQYVMTRRQLLDRICVLFGGREAEDTLLDDLSIGSGHDLDQATAIARALVEQFGMGSEAVGVRQYTSDNPNRDVPLSDSTRKILEEGVREILDQERKRARQIVEEHAAEITVLRDKLIVEKVLDATALKGHYNAGEG
jgi:cell division protease FtsH